MFCTDLLFEQDEYLEPVESYEVIMAVLNKVFKGAEPRLSKKYLHRYYESILEFTQFSYDEYHKEDGRSITSAENGKKGGRPPKQKDDNKDDMKVVNYNGRQLQFEQNKSAVLQRITKDSDKYREGMTMDKLREEFDDITPYRDRLKSILDSLESEGKIQMKEREDIWYLDC